MGGAGVVNQLYMYRSSILVLPIFPWKGINPLEFSSGSDFTLTIYYGKGLNLFRTLLLTIFLMYLL